MVYTYEVFLKYFVSKSVMSLHEIIEYKAFKNKIIKQ